MAKLNNRGDYITSRDWFADVLQGMDVILRGASALEHLQMFNGYLNESEIEVYALADTGYENINHHIVGSFDNIEWVEIAGGNQPDKFITFAKWRICIVNRICFV